MTFTTTITTTSKWLETQFMPGGRTLKDILMPTKGSDSYAKIAIRVNDWLSQKEAAGTMMDISRVSSEGIRKIFENLTAKPNRTVLMAIAQVQNISEDELYIAAGYYVPPAEAPEAGKSEEQMGTDPIERVKYALSGHVIDQEQLRELQRVLKMHLKKHDEEKKKE